MKAKYREEREKRLRADGPDQYRALDGVFADLDRDPFADPQFTRDPVAAETDVAIVGAGFGGLCAAAQLVTHGVADIRILDRAGDFGGTWYWNRYPGVACDVESYIYLPFLEQTRYMPAERYASGAEIFAYCRRLGRHYGLYDKTLFQTVVQDVRWDEGASRWRVLTDRGDQLSARLPMPMGWPKWYSRVKSLPALNLRWSLPKPLTISTTCLSAIPK